MIFFSGNTKCSTKMLQFHFRVGPLDFSNTTSNIATIYRYVNPPLSPISGSDSPLQNYSLGTNQVLWIIIESYAIISSNT